MRLDQFLVKTNICSRSQGKQLIKKGRVTVNGKVISDSSLHIDENTDIICMDGQQINYSEFHYYMLNKPYGCVSATRDGLSKTVIDMLGEENAKGLFPVGRLDKDTEGLLIIMDDGKLAHELLSPRHHVDKKYLVFSDTRLSEEQMQEMESGVDIGDEKITLPASVSFAGEVETDIVMQKGSTYCRSIVGDIKLWEYLLTIHEGRFHQVKRMFEHFGARVVYLKRLSMGAVTLDESLSEGEYRRLTPEEIDLLKNNKV